jgi:hypothetical protein
MWQLFTAELRRFRYWALGLGLVHLLVLAFFTRVVDLTQQPEIVYRVFAGIYCALGALFGLLQMGLYRKANTWLQLLHRPLHHWLIATALFGAGALLLAAAAFLPIAAVCTWQETMTARVLDLRHWLMPLAAALIAICGYLAGAYCILAHRRIALAGSVFLVVLALNSASGAAALAVQLILVLWLAALAIIAFKPDLAALPRRGFSLIVLGLPLQLGIYYLLILLCFGYELIWVVSGTHPNNSVPPRGGVIEAVKAAPRDLMLAGLAASDSPQASLWREQVALSEVFELQRHYQRLPRRGDLTNVTPTEIDDDQRRIRWAFSHDSMRFEGYSLVDNRASGVLNVGIAGEHFPQPVVPGSPLPGLPSGDHLLLSAGTLYQFRSDTAQVMPRMQLPAGEMFAVSPKVIGASIAVLSNRAVYFFDGRGLRESDALQTARLRVPLDGTSGNLTRIELIELVDGYLISCTFAATAHNARVVPRQQLLHAHDDGQIEVVARRELRNDYPQWHRYELQWLSPVLHAVHDAAINLFAEPEPLEEISPAPMPGNMWMLAGLLSLFSLLSAFWKTRRGQLTRGTRLGWLIACACVGLPALVNLWLLLPQREPRRQGMTASAAVA